MKNAISDGAALQAKGTAPGSAASGEADQYGAIRKIMKSIGCKVVEAQPQNYSGVSVVPGPSIVLKPNFVVCPAEYKEKFPNPSAIKISESSTLIVSGSGVVIESLDLDGALIINCEEGAKGVIRDLVIRNKGYQKIADESNTNEIIRMRGYRIVKHEAQTVTIKKDGSIVGLKPKSESPVKEAPQSRSVKPTDTPDAYETESTTTENKKQTCGCIIS